MTTAIDLFAGLGGWSTGATQAGVNVLWAANHWPTAVEWHAANHPNTQHVCQDLHQANWDAVPAHDILLASPCCQGHSKARGKSSGNPQHDASRSTAWAVVSAVEYHRPALALVENVPEFLQWALYPAWKQALAAMGYRIATHIVDCADLGVPQNRVRLFLAVSKSRAPLDITLDKEPHRPAREFIDFSTGNWSPVEKPGRAAATLARAQHGRANFGEQFLFSYYGNTKTARSIDRPIGTITTRDRWAIVNGDQMRMLTADECLAAMTFPANTQRPRQHRATVHMAGNAVPPMAGEKFIRAALAVA
ncbi:DNA cytosine methyltransferase [Oceanobacter sp. 4_MG-2023]|uniref:DNA cytosine methyltransferase n=1 Tax=Oceanobacter sp. 4_MG-2023 TaxID=3062623 RepID=UPI0027342CAA|nr:DNA cytosine methyltransferase [Oceanobacter sp. 4_MG-2023]MDP2548881.1 DNA cytosine methyltransferase [Oceanobacter sp. 4_MG-2023]